VTFAILKILEEGNLKFDGESPDLTAGTKVDAKTEKSEHLRAVATI